MTDTAGVDKPRRAEASQAERARNARREHIFISFKTEEREAAHRVKQALQAHGFKVWWQEEIQCGQEWHGELDKAVAQAGCVVVLWSARSMQSPWVRHEASQAIARGVYAPARIELAEIPPPFNRIQASDLMSWDGKESHPGFQDLLTRVHALLPEPVPAWKRALALLSRQRAAITAGGIASFALGLLIWQGALVSAQVQEMRGLVARQETMAKDVNRILYPLEDLEVSAWITVDPTPPEVEPYRDWMLQELSSAPKKVFESWVRQSEGANRRPVVVEPQLPLSPETPAWEAAEYALGYIDLDLSFSLDGAVPSAEHDAPDAGADLRIRLSEQAEVQWNLDRKVFWLKVRGRLPRQQWSVSTDRIASIPDLKRSTLQVQFEDITVPSDEAASLRVLSARRALRLQTLLLKMSGREFWLRSDNLKERIGNKGLRAYVAHLEQVSFGPPKETGSTIPGSASNDSQP